MEMVEKYLDEEYQKGYIAGYRDGIIAAKNGKTAENLEKDIGTLPIRGANLSTRHVTAYKMLDVAILPMWQP